jgi:hypothetical protein
VDFDSILDDSPGALAAAGDAGLGDLPQDGPIENLQADFSPTLTNLLPNDPAPSIITNSQPMDDLTGVGFSPSSLSDAGFGSTDGASDISGFPDALGTELSGVANQLLGAFVTNPANAQTQASLNAANAEIGLAQSSQLFGYLLIGLVIFLVFSLIERK